MVHTDICDKTDEIDAKMEALTEGIFSIESKFGKKPTIFQLKRRRAFNFTNQHSVNFSGNRPRKNKYIMKFICDVTPHNRLVRGICDFVVGHVTPNHKPPFCQV